MEILDLYSSTDEVLKTQRTHIQWVRFYAILIDVAQWKEDRLNREKIAAERERSLGA